MKKSSVLVGLVFVGMSIAANCHAQSFITNGLVACYPLNGNANDASGNGLNGTVVGATLTTNRFGSPNSAYSFNGSNNRIDFSASPLTNIANWTVSAWIQPASLTLNGIAVQVGYDDGITGNGYGLGVYASQWVGFHSGIGAGWIYSGQLFASTNNWYHVVMLRDNTTTKFFVNGLQTATTDTTAFRVPTDFTIGAANGVRYFKGSIDDVYIYNRALSSNEVAQLFSIQAGSLNIHKAVYLDTPSLVVGSNYQLQVSSDLVNWTNQGASFTATSIYWRSTNYYDVEDWNQLFFRLKQQ